MATLSNAIYSFNAIPIKVSTQFFKVVERAIVNFIWNIKKSRIVTSILNKEDTSLGMTIPDFMLYYIAIVIRKNKQNPQTVNRTKWQSTDWEKISTNPTSDRGLISKIYKELKTLDSRESNDSIKNSNA